MSASFMKTLKKGLISAAGSGVALAGKAIAKCLAEKMGYVSKKQQMLQEYKQWMASVMTSLDTLNVKVDKLSDDVKNGFGELKTESLFQAYQRDYDKLLEYATPINHAFQMLSNIISEDFADLKDFEKAVDLLKKYIFINNLQDATHNLAGLLGANAYALSRNMLENWTDTCIVATTGDKDANRFPAHYDNLEYNFQLGIGYLFKAYSVLTTLLNYDTGAEITVNDVKTCKWLEGEVKKYLDPVAASFVGCTERLILSTYRPDLYDNYISFANSGLILKAGTRSQLLAFLLTNMDELKESPGLITKEYLRPSMPEKGKSKITIQFYTNGKLTGGEEIQGVRWNPENKYVNGPVMANWYKVIDKDKSGKLIAFEDSDIIVMNYHQSNFTGTGEGDVAMVVSDYPTIVGSETLPIERTIKYKWYDADTLAELTEKKPEAIGFAYLVIQDHLSDLRREAFYSLSWPQASPGAYKFENNDEQELKKHAKDVHVSGPAGYDPATIVGVTCYFESPLISTNHQVGFRAKYPISYSPKTISGKNVQPLPGNLGDAVKLLLVNKMNLNIRVGDYKATSKSMRKADVEIDIFAMHSGKKTGYFNHIYKNNTALSASPVKFTNQDNKYYPAQASVVSEGQLGLPLDPGNPTELTWEVRILIEGLQMGGNNAYNNIEGTIYMTGRLAWPQPAPGFS